MSVIYQKCLSDQCVRFLVWLDETESGKPVVRISRSDAPPDPMNDIIVIGDHPVEIEVEHVGRITSVRVKRMQQIKVS